MSKIKLNKGLKLNKEAITKLQEDQMSTIKGGQNGGDSIKTILTTISIASCHDHSCNGKGYSQE